MCVASAIMDDYQKKWPGRWPELPPVPFPEWPSPKMPSTPKPWVQEMFGPSKEEFEKLKKEVQELAKLLKAAKKYDAATGQPDCEMAEKVAFIKHIAETVGVDLKDVI